MRRRCAADLDTPEAVVALADEMKARESKLHILINNAGRTWGAPLETFPDKAWPGVMAVNVQGPFTLVRELLPLLTAGAAAGGSGARHQYRLARGPARRAVVGVFVCGKQGGDSPSVARACQGSRGAAHHRQLGHTGLFSDSNDGPHPRPGCGIEQASRARAVGAAGGTGRHRRRLRIPRFARRALLDRRGDRRRRRDGGCAEARARGVAIVSRGSSTTRNALCGHAAAASLALASRPSGTMSCEQLDDPDVVDLVDLRADLRTHSVSTASTAVGDDAQPGGGASGRFRDRTLMNPPLAAAETNGTKND